MVAVYALYASLVIIFEFEAAYKLFLLSIRKYILCILSFEVIYLLKVDTNSDFVSAISN